MKTEFKSKVSQFTGERLHIEIPSYVRDDIEKFIGNKIRVIIKTQ